MIPSSQNFEFPWPIFRSVLEGLSIIDVPRLDVKSMEEATDFIQAYGFNPNDPHDIEIIWGVFDEGVQFIERALASPQYPRLPDHLRSRESIKDLRRLLLLGSAPMGDSDQLFACAILRVMHVLIHLAHDPRLKYFDQVQSQVLNRLDGHLYHNEKDGALYLGRQEDGGGVKLLFFKKKDRKNREREIIKLLHKKDNLVEDIYDRIGFRLVTESRFEAARALRFLLKKNIISVPNIRPGRSRNRMIDLDRFQFEVDRIRAHIEKRGTNAPYLEKMVKRLERRIALRRLGRSFINPFTSEHYQSFQFTCRELVKVKDPVYSLYRRLKEQLENLHGGTQILNETFSSPPTRPYSYVFFSYEMQIMDVKAYADSIFGKSNHEEYRRKQLETAKARVFGHLPKDEGSEEGKKAVL